MPASSERRLSEALEDLLAGADGQALSVGEIEARLKGRGFALLIMLLSAPFLVPNIPGLSTPFGAAITLMGARLACGQKPWLPQFVLRRELAYPTLERVVRVLIRFSLCMERVVKPRMHFLQRWPGMMNLIGFGIALGGFFLLLPLPIPFTNTLPALSILLLAAGMMERDGLFILVGYFFGIAAWVYLAAWLLLGKVGVDWASHWF